MYALRNKITGRLLTIYIEKEIGYQYEYDDHESALIDIDLLDDEFPGTIFVTNNFEMVNNLIKQGKARNGISGENTYISHFQWASMDLEIVDIAILGPKLNLD
jgi:hypothetical protein